jgi:hypothetical protein
MPEPSIRRVAFRGRRQRHPDLLRDGELREPEQPGEERRGHRTNRQSPSRQPLRQRGIAAAVTPNRLPDPRLVEVGSFFAEGYLPVLDFAGWRVAMLRYLDRFHPDAFSHVERHRETNEVFVLTAGRADLVVCDGDAQPGEPFVIAMEPNVAYNVGQGVWHGIVMSPDAHVVLFERTDTTAANSDYAELSADRIAAIAVHFRAGPGNE